MNMRKAIPLLALAMTLISCDKPEIITEPGNPNTDFNTRILYGYSVKDVAFDSEGNAWIGTNGHGLIKYSNGTTTVYDPSNSGMPSGFPIFDIKIDSKDNIWIGGFGLLKFDGTTFTLFNTSNSVIPEDYVFSIDIDSKDNVWFNSSRFRRGGIVKYDGNQFTVFTPDNSPLPVNFVQTITIDHDDNVWLGLGEIVNNASIIRISGSKWKVFTTDDLGFKPFYFGCLKVNSKNELCGSIDYSLMSTMVIHGPQVFIFDGNGSKLLNFDNMTRTWSITIDHEDNIWCCTFHGIAVYNGEEWYIKEMTWTAIYNIVQAPDKTIWLCTADGILINNPQ